MHGTYDELARWGTASTAVVLLAYGVARRSMPALLLTSVAVPLAYRRFAGRWPSDAALRRDEDDLDYTRASLTGDRGIHVREAIRLAKPIEELYRFWRQFENLPRFMTYLEQVTDLGGGRSRWVAKGPARSISMRSEAAAARRSPFISNTRRLPGRWAGSSRPSLDVSRRRRSARTCAA